VVVTEGYAPNVALAAERLGPLGVKVINLESSKYVPLPFDDGEFDLVLNRHSGVNSPEVARVLAPGGTYLTQQVHGLSGHDLIALFGAELQWPDATSERYVRRLEEAGLAVVTVEDWSGTTSFADVEAVVFYLKAIPWVVPGFSVATHLETLLELQRRLEAGEALTFSSRRYLVEARKPFDTEGAIQSPTG
jgi:SAM-dependent methyltransferase